MQQSLKEYSLQNQYASKENVSYQNLVSQNVELFQLDEQNLNHSFNQYIIGQSIFIFYLDFFLENFRYHNIARNKSTA